MTNRRRYARITVDIPAALSLLQIDTFHSGSISNFSIGGCFFEEVDNIPSGAECNITIAAGEGVETEEFTLKGVVVRSDILGTAVKFVDHEHIAPKIMRKISSYS